MNVVQASPSWKPLAVIFDMDGVIFDSEKLCMDCWDKLADRYGLKNMHEAFEKCIGTNRDETKRIMLEYYGPDFDYDSFAQKASALFHETVEAEGMPVKKGVRELLDFLKNRKMPIGLASSTRLAVVEEELKEAGIYDYFDVVVGGDMLKKSKPEPDIYLLACDKMGVEPSNAYAIEDSYNGIRSAYAAGMKPIMVPDLLPANQEMEQKSYRIAENLLQLTSDPDLW